MKQKNGKVELIDYLLRTSRHCYRSWHLNSWTSELSRVGVPVHCPCYISSLFLRCYGSSKVLYTKSRFCPCSVRDTHTFRCGSEHVRAWVHERANKHKVTGETTRLACTILWPACKARGFLFRLFDRLWPPLPRLLLCSLLLCQQSHACLAKSISLPLYPIHISGICLQLFCSTLTIGLRFFSID